MVRSAEGLRHPSPLDAARISPQGKLGGGVMRMSHVGAHGSRAVAPAVAPAGPGRALIAWSYNSETIGLTKSIEAVWFAR